MRQLSFAIGSRHDRHVARPVGDRSGQVTHRDWDRDSADTLALPCLSPSQRRRLHPVVSMRKGVAPAKRTCMPIKYRSRPRKAGEVRSYSSCPPENGLVHAIARVRIPSMFGRAAYSICNTRLGLSDRDFEDAWMISGRIANTLPLATRHSTEDCPLL